MSYGPEEPPHSVIRYEYSDDGSFCRQAEYTLEGERVGLYEEYTYDAEGRVVRKDVYTASDALFRTWLYAYDANGNKLSELDTTYGDGVSNVVETLYEYDADGNLLQITRNGNVLGGGVQYEIYERDASGTLLKVLLHDVNDERGIDYTWVRRLFEHDEHGNLSREYYYSAPDYDPNTDAYIGRYESGGTENWETMTIYVYDYDGDPYDKMPPLSEGE